MNPDEILEVEEVNFDGKTSTEILPLLDQRQIYAHRLNFEWDLEPGRTPYPEGFRELRERHEENKEKQFQITFRIQGEETKVYELKETDNNDPAFSATPHSSFLLEPLDNGEELYLRVHRDLRDSGALGDEISTELPEKSELGREIYTLSPEEAYTLNEELNPRLPSELRDLGEFSGRKIEQDNDPELEYSSGTVVRLDKRYQSMTDGMERAESDDERRSLARKWGRTRGIKNALGLSRSDFELSEVVLDGEGRPMELDPEWTQLYLGLDSVDGSQRHVLQPLEKLQYEGKTPREEDFFDSTLRDLGEEDYRYSHLAPVAARAYRNAVSEVRSQGYGPETVLDALK